MDKNLKLFNFFVTGVDDIYVAAYTEEDFLDSIYKDMYCEDFTKEEFIDHINEERYIHYGLIPDEKYEELLWVSPSSDIYDLLAKDEIYERDEYDNIYVKYKSIIDKATYNKEWLAWD